LFFAKPTAGDFVAQQPRLLVEQAGLFAEQHPELAVERSPFPAATMAPEQRHESPQRQTFAGPSSGSGSGKPAWPVT
jgi:hypothetical protein